MCPNEYNRILEYNGARVRMHACMCACEYVHACTRVHACACSCVCVFVRVRVCVRLRETYMHACICTSDASSSVSKYSFTSKCLFTCLNTLYSLRTTVGHSVSYTKKKMDMQQGFLLLGVRYAIEADS